MRTVMLMLVAPFLFLACATTPAEGESQGAAEPPWAALEQQLRDAGAGTDTASLIALADSDRDAGLRWFALEVLGLRGEQAGREVLWRVLSSEEDPLLRETAALALARLGDERGLRALRDFARTTPTVQRQLALAARLAELGDASGYPQVLEATKSEDAFERFLSVAGLVPFVGLHAGGADLPVDPVGELLRLAQDEDPTVRYEVLVQLPFAARRGAPVPRLKPAVEKMAQEDPAPDVREKAGLVLTLWGSAG